MIHSPKRKILTIMELSQINQRIREIDELVELCDFGDELLDSYEAMLDELMLVLKESIHYARIKESGLRVVCNE